METERIDRKSQSMPPEFVRRVLDGITYRDWSFDFESFGDGYAIRAFYPRGGSRMQGQRWYVAPHAGEMQLVQLAMIAVIVAEWVPLGLFFYNGVTFLGNGAEEDLQTLRSTGRLPDYSAEGAVP